MTDETKPPEQTWQEVGDQFRTLGESLAAAFRATWENEENRQHLRELRKGMEGMANSLGQAVQDAAKSPEAQHVEAELRKAANTAQAAGQQAWQDAEPHLLSALRQVNAELEKIVRRTEQRREGEEATAESGDEAG